jgi:membrane-associated phospholipid phosphatase
MDNRLAAEHPHSEAPCAGETARQTDRRRFLRRVAAGTSGAVALGLAWPAAVRGSEAAAASSSGSSSDDNKRIQQAEKIRTNAAKLASRRPQPDHPTNGEEKLYPNRIASYSKALPHNRLGEVDSHAYDALLDAMKSGKDTDFEKIPLGLGRRLTNPQAAFGFDLEGADSHHMAIAPAPTIAGARGAGELAEVYWMALSRDVHFSDYASDPTAAAAAAELSRFSDFQGPKSGGSVTPGTLFRGDTPGDLAGPYLSQFLWLDIPMGALLFPQKMQTTVFGDDYMTGYEDWLAVQNGSLPGPNHFDATPRYIRNLRDLAQWVHVDALYQAYHQACLILLATAPFDAGNPYARSVCQEGFGTFGGPHILSLVTEVATRALKAVWYQKWSVHRRLRPEAMAGLVHLTRSGLASYPLNREILNAPVLDRLHSANGSYLLPMAFPEGSPTHPSYGAGHATVAGACVTVLKAWFDESFVLPRPVVPDAAGLSLVPYSGPSLTVGNELNKLAANVAIGRNAAGVHYRSDYSESVRLGEELALDILEEQKATYNETFSFTLTRFDGTTVTI